MKRNEAKWQVSSEYYVRKIKNLERAIDGTLKALAEFTVAGADDRTINAHVAQVNSYRKSLEQVKNEFNQWAKI